MVLGRHESEVTAVLVGVKKRSGFRLFRISPSKSKRSEMSAAADNLS